MFELVCGAGALGWIILALGLYGGRKQNTLQTERSPSREPKPEKTAVIRMKCPACSKSWKYEGEKKCPKCGYVIYRDAETTEPTIWK